MSTESTEPVARRPGRPRKIVDTAPMSGNPGRMASPLVLHLHAGDYEPKGMSIGDFCVAYGISRHTYIRLRKAGLGPAELKLDRRAVITTLACLEWEAMIRHRSLPDEEKTLAAQLATQGCQG